MFENNVDVDLTNQIKELMSTQGSEAMFYRYLLQTLNEIASHNENTYNIAEKKPNLVTEMLSLIINENNEIKPMNLRTGYAINMMFSGSCCGFSNFVKFSGFRKRSCESRKMKGGDLYMHSCIMQ